MPANPPDPATRGLWSDLVGAARRNLRPGLCLQGVAVGLVAAWYLWPAARPAFAAAAAAKASGGYLFSAVSTAIAAGLVPWLVDAGRGRIPRRLLLIDLAFVIALWSWRGAEVDLFYRCQDLLFGSGTDPATIARKVAFDMLLYAPLWAQPVQVACYRFRDAGYDPAGFRRGWTWGDFARNVLTVQVGGWLIWVSTVCIIYSLPSDLRIPLFAVMICFWSLLLAALTGRR